MNCQRVQRFLSLYHDGHPAGREDAAVASHVRDCPACRQFRESLSAWSRKVRTAGENEPALGNPVAVPVNGASSGRRSHVGGTARAHRGQPRTGGTT